jgi:hypothetical protein
VSLRWGPFDWHPLNLLSASSTVTRQSQARSECPFHWQRQIFKNRTGLWRHAERLRSARSPRQLVHREHSRRVCAVPWSWCYKAVRASHAFQHRGVAGVGGLLRALGGGAVPWLDLSPYRSSGPHRYHRPGRGCMRLTWAALARFVGHVAESHVATLTQHNSSSSRGFRLRFGLSRSRMLSSFRLRSQLPRIASKAAKRKCWIKTVDLAPQGTTEAK